MIREYFLHHRKGWCFCPVDWNVVILTVSPRVPEEEGAEQVGSGLGEKNPPQPESCCWMQQLPQVRKLLADSDVLFSSLS